MKTIVYIVPSSSDIIRALNRKGIPYLITYTNNTTSIKTEIGGQQTKYLCSDRGLRFDQLAFIQKVKSHVQGLNRPELNIFTKDVQYYKYNDLQDGFYDDVTEVDVNQAYWKIAYQKGYLSKDIYEQGLKVDKMTRLISWGAIATSSRTYLAEGKNKTLVGEKVNKRTRSYFFDVAQDLGWIMSEALNKYRNSILFFWVDAFFIQGRSAPAAVKRHMIESGLPCKTVPLWHIHVKNRGEFADLITVTTAEGKEKPFHRKKGNRQLFQFQQYCSILQSANDIS